MRVEQIQLYSNDSEVVSFDMTGPDVRNPYTIKAITGLDAEEIVPRYYASGLVSGTKFNELTLTAREVTMRIDMKPNYRLSQHPADLRARIMRAIASSRNGTIQLRFLDGGVCWGAISGFITKFEAPLTSKDTELQFTIKCDDPIIRSLNVTSQNDLPTFETITPMIIDPMSTSPHGFKFRITFDANSSIFIIKENAPVPDWHFTINFAFLTGDELYFSSEWNDKYIYVMRSLVLTHLMDVLDPNSTWPMMFPGENQFEMEGSGGFAGDYTWNELFWHETHWGV